MLSWCCDQSLGSTFPVLFTRMKKASVVDHYHPWHDSNQWGVIFTREANDPEEYLFNPSLTGYTHVAWDRIVMIKWFGSPSRRGVPEVKSYCYVLCTHSKAPFSWKLIWINRAPTKVAFFTWTALGRILTSDDVRRCVACVGKMRIRWIIFFYIARL